MERVYKKPTMVVEQFVSDEYVAACGDKNTVYKFKCDAPAGPLYYFPKGDGIIDGHYTGRGGAELLGITYHPCKKEHEANTTNPFYDGFVDRNWNGKCDPGEEVIVWRGPKNDNGHATANLDMTTWETDKS